MGLADQINEESEARRKEIEARGKEAEQKKIDHILSQLDFHDGPTPVYVETIDEKEWIAPNWQSSGRWEHKRWYVVSLDDVIVHANYVKSFGQSDANLYIPQTCAACRKPDRVPIAWHYSAYIVDQDGRPRSGIRDFVKAYSSSLATFRTAHHSRCWECRKEVP